MKKNISTIAAGTLMALAAVSAASCSDDLDYELFTKYTYLMDNGWQEEAEMKIEDDNTVGLSVYFGVNGTTANKKNITLTLGVDPDTLNSYNFDKYKNDTVAYYSLLPSDCYSFDKPSYTIPAGQVNSSAVCMIDLEKLRQHGIYDEYVLPLQITSSQGEPVGPSAYTKALYLISLENEYSGTYSGNGNMKQIGTSYTTQVQGKHLYAISNDQCYIYAGNVDRSTEGGKRFLVNLRFNDDMTVTMAAVHPEIKLKPISGTYKYKFTENTSDSRKLIRMTTIELKYEYHDVSDIYQDVDYSYEATLTKTEDVFRKDYPDAVIDSEE